LTFKLHGDIVHLGLWADFGLCFAISEKNVPQDSPYGGLTQCRFRI